MIPRETPVHVVRAFWLVDAIVVGALLCIPVYVIPALDFTKTLQRHERAGLPAPDEDWHEFSTKPIVIICSFLPAVFGLVLLVRRATVPMKVAVFPSGMLLADHKIGTPDLLVWNEIEEISVGQNLVLACPLRTSLKTGVAWETNLPLAFASRRALVEAIKKASGESVKITVAKYPSQLEFIKAVGLGRQW